CLLVCVAILVVGTVVFSTAATVNGLVGGRILIGLGAASFLVAPLTLYARWFAPERFSTLAGIHIGIGTLGTLCATAPLAFPGADDQLFEPDPHSRPVGRALSHPHLRLRPPRPRRYPADPGAHSDCRIIHLGPDGPGIRRLQAAGADGPRAYRVGAPDPRRVR